MTNLRFAIVHQDDIKASRIPRFKLPAYLGDGYKNGLTTEWCLNIGKGKKYMGVGSFKGCRLINHPERLIMRYVEKEVVSRYLRRGWYLGYLEGAKLVLRERKSVPKITEYLPKKFGETADWQVIDPHGKVYLIRNLSRFCRTRSLDYDMVRYGKTDWKVSRVG